MKSKSILLWLLTPVVAITAYAATMTTITCQNVSTTAVSVLAANASRAGWAIWTTSGAPTVYFRADGTAATYPNGSTGFLPGGSSYSERRDESSKAAVSAVTKTGTAYVCVEESQ